MSIAHDRQISQCLHDSGSGLERASRKSKTLLREVSGSRVNPSCASRSSGRSLPAAEQGNASICSSKRIPSQQMPIRTDAWILGICLELEPDGAVHGFALLAHVPERWEIHLTAFRLVAAPRRVLRGELRGPRDRTVVGDFEVVVDLEVGQVRGLGPRPVECRFHFRERRAHCGAELG
jgi:hypothetical protein